MCSRNGVSRGRVSARRLEGSANSPCDVRRPTADVRRICGGPDRSGKACWTGVGLLLSLVLAGPVVTAAQDRASPAMTVLGPADGPNAFPPLYRRALNVFISAENQYERGQYQEASDLLEKLWNDFPPGSPAWTELEATAFDARQATGVNIGSPGCYAALRMLTECVAWKLDKSPEPTVQPIFWTILLVGQLESRMPRNSQERQANRGPRQILTLDPRLTDNDYQVLRQSTRLFIEYVAAITRGQLVLKLRFLPLPDLKIPGHLEAEPGTFAGPEDASYALVWAAVPEAVKAETDWWMMIHPSNVPDQPDFKTTEFVTGGMGIGPRGADPCFLIDDRWFLRKPPHLGFGEMHVFERRAYLPQWFQHEFFHHLYRTYPEYRLEGKRGHEWFNRRTWPEDFEGALEPDYYHESLHKRLMRAPKPLQAALKYRPPDLTGIVTLDMLPGTYERQPRENNWHTGRLERDGQGFRWTNDAGVSWRLTADLPQGALNCAADSPYFDEASGRQFYLDVETTTKPPRINGFRFNGALFRRR